MLFCKNKLYEGIDYRGINKKGKTYKNGEVIGYELCNPKSDDAIKIINFFPLDYCRLSNNIDKLKDDIQR